MSPGGQALPKNNELLARVVVADVSGHAGLPDDSWARGPAYSARRATAVASTQQRSDGAVQRPGSAHGKQQLCASDPGHRSHADSPAGTSRAHIGCRLWGRQIRAPSDWYGSQGARRLATLIATKLTPSYKSSSAVERTGCSRRGSTLQSSKKKSPASSMSRSVCCTATPAFAGRTTSLSPRIRRGSESSTDCRSTQVRAPNSLRSAYRVENGAW